MKANNLKYTLLASQEELYLTQQKIKNFKLKGIQPEQLTNREFDIVICAFAQAFELKPETVKTIIAIESSWDSNAISHMDCRGLMQIHPRTALDGYGIEKNKLFDPWINIRLGCDYYSSLKRQFKDRDTALVAYNSGPSNAKKVKEPDKYPYVKKFNEILPTYQ